MKRFIENAGVYTEVRSLLKREWSYINCSGMLQRAGIYTDCSGLL